MSADTPPQSLLTGPLGDATSQSDLIADAIRKAILNGRLPSGHVLVERQLASELDVSKTPVREALIQLTASGLVKTTRNRKSVVRSMSDEDARHVYEKRLLIEPWAFETSVRSGQIDLVEADRLFQQSERLREAADWPALVLANRSFHQALYRACPNPLVVESLDRLQDLTALATLTVVWSKSKMTFREHTDHRRLLKHAESGEATKGAQLMRDHIDRALRQRTQSQ